MDNSQAQQSILSLNYVSDDGYLNVSCACGTKIFLTQEQFETMSSCGCETRKLLLLAVGGVEDSYEMTTDSSASGSNSAGRGVRFDKGKNKWRARITFQGKEYHLGYSLDKEAATARRNEAEAHLNSGFIEWFNRTCKNAPSKDPS